MVRISISELEATVSTMVKSSQPTPDKLVKPLWWPANCQFPLERHAGMQRKNWREFLHNLILKCYQFNNRDGRRTKRLKPNCEHTGKREKKHFDRRHSGNSSSGSSTSSNRIQLKTKQIHENQANGVRMRRDSTGSSADSTVSSLSGGAAAVPLEKEAVIGGTNRNQVCSGLVRSNSGGDGSASHSEISVAEVLATNLGIGQKLPNRGFSPIVQVYDVCKVNHPLNMKFASTVNFIRKNENCDAIKRDIHVEKSSFMNYFGLDTKSDGVMLPNKDVSRNTALNAKQKSNLVNCPQVPFSSNLGLKLIKGWHNYDNDVIEKRLERLERYLCNSDLPSLLSPVKDQFKIINNKNSDSRSILNHFYIFPTKKRHRHGKLTPKARFFLEKYCKPCFVNLNESGDNEIKKYLDARKQKTIDNFIKISDKEDKQKENKTPFTLLESRVVLTPIDKCKESASLLAKTVNRSNFALQTLAPRNANQVESTNSPLMLNFINPSVVLQPIHELFEFTKRGKILHSATHKVPRPAYKVAKTRVNVYNPRRFSTRLHEVINV